MEELTAFLNARLDEDEAALRDDDDDQPGEVRFADMDNRTSAYVETFADSARVRREIEAKRAILALHDRTHSCPIGSMVGDPEWLYVSSEHVGPGDLPPYWPCTTVRHLAAVCSDHPDCPAIARP